MIKTQPRNFIFDTVKMTAPERNGFDLSHENKQTCKAGYIYPFEILEALPNDDFQIQTEQLIRLQPMLSPTMHRLKSYWHWFFVPNRLVWNYWEEFISRGNGKKLPDNDEYTPPEPVTISLYDMIYCLRNRPLDSTDTDWIWNMIQEYFGVSTLNIARVSFWNLDGGLDARVNVLQQCFPEFKFVRLRDSSSSTRFLVFASTPRVATSMGIVDTAIPLFILNIDNSAEKISIDANSYTPCTVDTSSKFDGEQYYTGGKLIYLGDVIKRLLSIKISVMPFLAYMLIYNEYYRDENLINELDEILTFFREETGQINVTENLVTFGYVSKMLNLFYRAWEKDYFTTCTTMPQKAPDVLIPNIPSTDNLKIAGDLNLRFVEAGETTIPSQFNARESFAKLSRDGDNLFLYAQDENNPQSTLSLGYKSGLKIQGSNGTSKGTTVADVRKAFALQRWFEKAVRTGTRYIETLKAFFNSDAGDARLQRPEYIGGNSEPIQISDTVQTSATADGSDTPQGNLAGYGISAGSSQVLSYHAPEHGFVIGCFSILARTSYAQQVPKMFSRETWLDYAFPEFEHIGEQGVQNKELFGAPLTKDILLNPNYSIASTEISDTANQNFGYQSRYCEYKQVNDRFGGAFARSLDFWSLGRIFNNPPTLSQQFVNAKISERNFAVQNNDEEFEDSHLSEFRKDVEDVDTDQYICDFWVDVKKVTSLTLFSEPI